MASEKQKPVGAAQFMMNEDDLGLMLNLPEGVHVERVFVPYAHWGRSIGFILWAEKEGILPPTPEPGEELQDISRSVMGETFHLRDGERYYHLLFRLPQKEASDGK